jgi:hypothetical protein
MISAHIPEWFIFYENIDTGTVVGKIFYDEENDVFAVAPVSEEITLDEQLELISEGARRIAEIMGVKPDEPQPATLMEIPKQSSVNFVSQK